ncbi:DUF6671 family protein [Leptolyngbya iicbica]|uniref:DUF6671 domain-containing protein n=2 Tax=Cyanophyceae TaxID=3028117 RepID=A0A4Q7E4Y8_9CYAN|nr:DUF6671 family protein [Leptolyngbya sp. LK]RZM77363.1 hypothetical protein DYY88_17150 [Leptolyngbya sp. LK]
MREATNQASEFIGRQAVIATMHRKEQAIAPLLQSSLGVSIHVPPDFNTDRLGTFTRDIKRPADQLATARLKAQAALDLTGGDLAIASEGSFGPHPEIPFVPCDRELVLLLDRQHNLEIVGQAISTQTNYRAQTVRSVDEAVAFATAVGFPKHGVVVMPTDGAIESAAIAKGITTKQELTQAVSKAIGQSERGTAHIETDMRAHYNPTRMQVIAAATENLIQLISQRCPSCQCPGFSIARRNPGLPCAWCHTPTLLPLSVTYRCQRCDFGQAKNFPDGQQTADPGNCAYCNP